LRAQSGQGILSPPCGLLGITSYFPRPIFLISSNLRHGIPLPTTPFFASSLRTVYTQPSANHRHLVPAILFSGLPLVSHLPLSFPRSCKYIPRPFSLNTEPVTATPCSDCLLSPPPDPSFNSPRTLTISDAILHPLYDRSRCTSPMRSILLLSGPQFVRWAP